MAENVPKLGRVLEGEQHRDAIHIAVAPVVASERLSPGQHVGFIDATLTEVGPVATPIGIVDPFLIGPVFKSERVWLFLYQNTITTLRHEWTHPAFARPAAPSGQPFTPLPPSKAEAEKWLREFAERADLSFHAVVRAGRDAIETGDYLVQMDQETARDEICLPGAREAFWQNWEAYTGVTPSAEDREHYVFSCSC